MRVEKGGGREEWGRQRMTEKRGGWRRLKRKGRGCWRHREGNEREETGGRGREEWGKQGLTEEGGEGS